MRTLILLRHAKAERPEGAQLDEERRLTGRGRRDAEAAGLAIAAAGLKPGCALISPAQRTRETAEFALKPFQLDQVVDDELYHGSPAAIWQAFFAADSDSVIVIGHNPGIGELVTLLIGQAHDFSKSAREFAGNFPTAAWAAFSLRGDMMRAAGPTLLGAWKPEKDDR